MECLLCFNGVSVLMEKLFFELQRTSPSSYPCPVPCQRLRAALHCPHPFSFIFISPHQPRAAVEQNQLQTRVAFTFPWGIGSPAASRRAPHLAEHVGSCFLPTLRSEGTGQRGEEDKAFQVGKALCRYHCRIQCTSDEAEPEAEALRRHKRF